MSAFIQVNFDKDENLSKEQVLDLLGMRSVEGPAIYGGLELDVRYVEVPENWTWEEHFLEIGNGGDLADDVMTQEFIVDQSDNLFEVMESSRGKKLISRIPSFEKQLVDSKEQIASLNALKTMYPNSLPDTTDLEDLLNQGVSVNKKKFLSKKWDTLVSALDTKTVMGRILSTLEGNSHPFLESLRDQAYQGKKLSAKQIAAIGKFSANKSSVDNTLLKRINAVLKKKPNNKFIKSLQSQVNSGRKLSQKQLDALGNIESGKKRPTRMTVSKFQTLNHHDRIKEILKHLKISTRPNLKTNHRKLIRELYNDGMRGTPINKSYSSGELNTLREIIDYLVKGGGQGGNDFLESLTTSERSYWVHGTFLTY